MSRVRFRYATEGEKAGNIYGMSSTEQRQTFPTVVVSVSKLVTHDDLQVLWSGTDFGSTRSTRSHD